MENKKIYGYVYLITNKINGKQYVGQTVRAIKKRFMGHISDSKLGITYISRAIKKYGIKNFKIEEIDVSYNQEELNLLEGVYISWFNTLAPSGYNIKEIIDGKGKSTKETKEKIRSFYKQNKTSKYIGVHKFRKYWKSSIKLDYKYKSLGIYNTEIDAAKAYDIAAIEYYGNDCYLNIPELRNKYINKKVNIIKNTKSTNSKSGIENVRYNKNKKYWFVVYNGKTKYFKYINDAIEFKKVNF